MSSSLRLHRIPRRHRGWLVACIAAFLSACGGGGTDSSSTASPSAEIATGTTILSVDGAALPQGEADVLVQPTYHLSPVLPPPPSTVDAQGLSLSAFMAPQVSVIPETLRSVSTRGLTPDQLASSSLAKIASADEVTASGVTPKVSVTYSPAQIRAAYGLPTLPSSLAGLTAAQAAQLGAGQTIYIVDAYHDPNAFAELTAFNQRFGLPGCTNKTLATGATLPLAAPTVNACDFYQVYSTTSAGMSATAPAYNSGWATEIALDVQWAHAIAPLARIVLIEAPDASVNSLAAAIQLANRMGPGAVSMSFGGSEGSYVTALDSYFKAAGMSYFAATGDNGAGVSWPSISPYVVAVGGTSLTYSGTGARSEIAWSGTGGGLSAYATTPSYQTSTVPGMGTPRMRSVADVAFNADPGTGQYVAVIQSGTACSSCQVGWVSAGGTSLSTPQWAGLATIANAMRVQSGKAVLGDPHSLLYTQVASVAGTYAAGFVDITQGSNGTCTTCTAKTGYDTPTGLGTPNSSALLNTLTGVSTATPPVVTGATISGTTGKALTFTASIVGANPYTLSLSGAPSGMTISSAGIVSWPAPAVGTYKVTVVAKDTKTGLIGQGVYNVVITAPVPPTVSSGTATGVVGKALSFKVTVTGANPFTLTLSGAPSGMSVSSTGVVSWASPVVGTYKVTVTAKDSKTNLTGQGVYTVTITASAPPAVGSASVSGTVGKALSFNVTVTSANAYTLTLSGAPSGMTISSTGTINWASPVAGTYRVTVTAKDSKTALTGQGVYTVTVTAATTAGPVISAPALTGTAGKALSGTIKISDTKMVTGVAIIGAPLGMSFSVQGSLNTIAVSWPSPVAGTYTLQIIAADAGGLQASTTMKVTITK